MNPFIRRLKSIILLALIPLSLLFVSIPAWATPLADPGINRVYITDVNEGRFIVSWTTDDPSDGHIDWGSTPSLGETTSDTASSTTTHHVMIDGLDPETTYFFKVRSGDATDDNGGAKYAVTTGPLLGPASLRNAYWGYVYESGGTTPVPNAIVYMQLVDNDASGSSGSSQWVTARTNSEGVWQYKFGATRLADLSGYFDFSDNTDLVRIVFQGGDKGVVGELPADERTFPTPAEDFQQLDITLDGVPNTITMSAFTVRDVSRQLTFSILGLSVLFIIAAFLVWRRLAKRPDA